MDNELALKLKNAGFPQDTKLYWVKGVNGWIDNVDRESFDGVGHSMARYIEMGEAIASPDLSELIKACGDRFGSLDHLANGKWRATMWYNDVKADGPTPEEAVANLWLSLHAP